ncbi:hypothetical protein [Bradyrhizobium brasilense]|uniref:DUF4102 domain-containing protein n=1 Tax=Bradyrhizobium brasilense TaxID=1419277 RepID=A0ABY8JRU6_9BRAD|nr:hypothetical protein [Bradyrhizobium brasilense]WFU66733.1 hypothetical protein QA636_15015 [Bradyrhizobium brasilense]
MTLSTGIITRTRLRIGMTEIEVHTDRYEREHGRKPAGRRFWRFTLVSSTVTAKDHHLDIGQPLAYRAALEQAKEMARLRKSEQIIVKP